MASRNPDALHPYLRDRWPLLRGKYEHRFPGRAMVLTCTYRSPEEQQLLYAQGRTGPGKKVTQIDGKTRLSNHNHQPAKAFDVVILVGGKVSWDESLYQDALPIARELGLACGGDWRNFKDWPHFEMPKETA